MVRTIKTDRLFLQPLSEQDICFIQDLATRPESFKFDKNNAPSADEIIKRCHWYMEREKALPNEGAIRWIIKYNDTRIGEVHVICNWEETSEWEIGWYLLPEYWGKGFAAEAVKSVIQYVFSHFKINRLAAFLNAENDRSMALAERVGMVREGRLREVRYVKGAYYDEFIYSILRHDFKTT
jgi:RimJ/RimL family protein N-acetyltransferase